MICILIGLYLKIYFKFTKKILAGKKSWLIIANCKFVKKKISKQSKTIFWEKYKKKHKRKYFKPLHNK
jgi:hypothetical protein